MNRLSPEYWQRIQEAVTLRVLTMLARERDEATEGGYKYGEVKVSPELQQAMINVANPPPPIPPPRLLGRLLPSPPPLLPRPPIGA